MKTYIDVRRFLGVLAAIPLGLLPAALCAQTTTISTSTTKNIGSTGDRIPTGADVVYVVDDDVTLTFSATGPMPGNNNALVWNSSATSDSLTIGPAAGGSGVFVMDGGGSYENPSFSNAGRGGAAFYLGGAAGIRHTITLTSGTIKCFWATSNGGVVFMNTGNNKATFNNVVFENNGVKALNQQASGGVFFANNAGTQVVNLTDVTFVGNKTAQYNDTQTNALQSNGGAIYFLNGAGALNMINVNFIGNCVTGNNQVAGRAATGYGGAIYLGGGSKLTMSGGTFSGNYAEAFTSVGAGQSNGGAIYQTAASLSMISNVTFTGNTAFNNGGAVTLAANGGTIGLTNVLFENNRSANGGGLYLQSGDWGALDGVIFRSNNASNSGAALYLIEAATSLGSSNTFNNITFVNNVVSNTLAANVSVYGGAMYMNTNGWATMSNVLVSGNTARASSLGQSATALGGAIYQAAQGTLLIIDSGTFEKNMATGAVVSGTLSALGGAIYQDRASYMLSNVLFDQNTADTAGGALYVTITPAGNAVTVSDTLNNAIFTDNRAGRGGAIAMELVSATRAANVNFITNGGAFTGNSAEKIGSVAALGAGGAAFIKVDWRNTGTGATAITADFNDVLFADNTARGVLGAGGAIAISGSNAVANIAITSTGQDMTYTGNAAYGNGGATPDAALGGFVYSTTNATVNFNIASGKTLSIGSAGSTSTDTVVGDTTSVINVNAGESSNTGALVLHADNSANQARVQVARGSLLLGNASARLGGPITVSAGAAFGGMGTATGNVAVGLGGILNIGLTHNDASVTAPQHLIIDGTLTLDNALLRFDLYTGQQSDLLTVGSIIQTGTSYLDVNLFRSGTFKLIDVTGAGGLSTFDLSLLAPATFNGSSLAKGNTETYRIIDNSLYLILGLTNHIITWTGTASSSWAGGVNNWISANSNLFSFGDKVIFDDSVPSDTARAIAIANGGVQASDMVVSGTGDYIFTGGIIVTSTADSTLAATASAKLIKDDSGTLDLTGQNTGVINDFQGGIDLNGGMLRVATAGQLGSALSNVNFLGTTAASSTLAIAPVGALALDAAGDDTQRIIIAAGKAGVIDLGANSSLTIRNNNSTATAGGAVNVAASGVLTLAAASGAAYHFDNNTSAANGGAIYNAGQLTLANANFAANIAVAGGAIYNDAATLRLEVTAGGSAGFIGNTASGTASSIHNAASAGNVTLDISIASGGMLDMRDPMTGAAANGNTIAIISTGAGLWKLGGTNAFTSDSNAASKTTFAATSGTLSLYQDAAITLAGNASVLTLGAPAGSATLELGGANIIAAPRIDILNTTITFASPGPGHTLALNGATTLDTVDLNIRAATGNTADKIAVTGIISLLGANTLNITRWNSGTFAIITSDAALAASAATTFAPVTYDGNSLAGRQSASLFLDDTGRQLMLALISTNALRTWTGNSTVWDTSAGTSWVEDDNRFIANDSVRFDDTAAGGLARTVAIFAAGVQAADIVVETTGAYTFNGSGAIETSAACTTIAAATGALTKLGSGTLTLANTAPNTFSGGINIAEGTLIGNAAALGVGPAGVSISNIGTLVIDQATDATYAGNINGAGALVKTSAGNLALAGITDYTGATQLAAGSLTLANANQITSSATVTLAAATTLYTGANSQRLNALGGSGNIAATSGTLTLANTTASTLYAGAITGAVSVTKDGSATLTLAGNNTYTGVTTIASGTLQLGAGGATGSVASAIVNNAALSLNHGANDITLANTITGIGVITKLASDTGALTLTADSSAFDGVTNILAGTLLLADTAKLGGLVNLGAGAGIAANGSLTGQLNAQAGSAITIGLTHASYTVKLPQTLLIGGTLTLANDTTLRYDLYDNSAADLITAATLARTGTSTIDLNTATSGAYKLITTTAALAVSSTTDLLTTINGEQLSARSTASFTNDGNNLWLNLYSENYAQSIWNGSNTAEWTENIREWRSDDEKFLNGDSVLFDDTADTFNVIVALGGVRAADMTVDAANVYTFTGGAITTSTVNSTLSGSSTVYGRLEKQGAGTLILNNGANNFTGGILITDGTLQGNITTFGAGDPGITNNAVLVFDQADDGAYSGAITGNGALVKQNTGTLTLTNGTNNYAGGIHVAAGALELLNSGTTTQGALDISSDALLRIGNSACYSIEHALTGAGTLAIALDNAASQITFAPASGTDFNGAMQLGQGTFMLDNASATALRNASLDLGANNTTIVGATGGAQQIGNLSLNGATLVFTATIPADPTANEIIQTANLALNSGTVQVTIPATGLDNPLPAGGVNFFAQDDGSVITRLIEASGNVIGNVTALTLIDQNGLAVSASTAQTVVIAEGGITVANGTYNYMLDSTGGLNVTYGLTALELVDGNTLHLSPDFDATGNAADLKVAITGTGNLSIAAATAVDSIVTISNIANTFTGTTIVTSGTLQLAAANALGTGSFNGLALDHGAGLHLNSLSQTLGIINTATASALNIAGGVLTINNGGAIHGNLAGAGMLEVTGGVLQVTSANTALAANIFISNSGAINLADATGLGSGNITFRSDTATLILNTTGSSALGNLMTGPGALVKTGDGSVALTANNSAFSGPVTVDAGRLIISNTNGLGTGPVEVGAAGSLDIAVGTTRANDFSGLGTLNFVSGSSTLSGANTIAQINILAGAALTTTGSASLGTPESRIAIRGGTLIISTNGLGTGNVTMSGSARLGFTVAAGFRTLTLASLTSTDAGSTLIFNTNLSASGDTVKNDTIIVTGAVSGTYKLALNNINTTAPSLFDTTLNLVQATGAAATYILEHDTMTIGNSLTLYNVSVLPGPGATVLIRNTDDLSELGACIVNTAGATPLTWLAELDTIEQRMGDIRLAPRYTYKEFWVRGYARRLDVKKHATGAAFGENQYGAEVGFDFGDKKDNGSASYLGFFAGYGATRRDMDNTMGNGHGNTLHGGIYATMITPAGWYFDIIGKYNHFTNNLTAQGNDMTITGRYVNDAFGASVEAGKLVHLGERWFVQPSVQAAGARYSSADYKTSSDMVVVIDPGTATQLRAGTLLGYKYTTPSGKYLQPYAKVRASQLWTSGNQVAAGLQRRKTAIDGGRLDTGLGVNLASPGGVQIYLDYERSWGDDYNKPYNIIAGIHYSW